MAQACGKAVQLYLLKITYLELMFAFLQDVLYCAKKAGVTHILKAGGAQGVNQTYWITYVVILDTMSSRVILC